MTQDWHHCNTYMYNERSKHRKRKNNSTHKHVRWHRLQSTQTLNTQATTCVIVVAAVVEVVVIVFVVVVVVIVVVKGKRDDLCRYV